MEMRGTVRYSLWIAPWWALGFALAAPTATIASDYSHECRSADGQYEMWDEELSATSDEKKTAIPYTTLKDTILAQKEGYCLSRGSKFGYESKTYVRKVRFERDGERIEIDLLCELATDGLPAAYSCEKEVVTRQTQSSGGGQQQDRQDGDTTTAIWSHNGSVMRLEANGEARIFSYENPRPGMRNAGAKQGDIVFEGKRVGQTYSGTAYIFSKDCGRTAYPVTGSVLPGDRGVVLEGDAPVLGKGCKQTATRHDRLQFDYVAR
jgi:hypothetical protein